MIPQFPCFYPDELVYSLLARYYARSGYMRYVFAAEDLFVIKTVRPDIEFVNAYTEEVLQMLTKEMPMEKVIEKHTMFPYYGRFLQKERRKKAFEALVKMEGRYYNLLPRPKNKEESFLRYCPLCVQKDREQYGETYWHRIHQLQEIAICPIHNCRLTESRVLISGKTSPSLITAESVVCLDSTPVVYCASMTEKRISQYAARVFLSDLDLETDIVAGDFLHSRMAGTKYRSVRGEQRNIRLLHTELMDYYKNFLESGLKEEWKIQKILSGSRINFFEICQLAMFLEIPDADLVKMVLPSKPQEQVFDEQIFLMRRKGCTYPEIAKKLNAPYDTVKAIGELRYKKKGNSPCKSVKCGKKAYNWEQIDKETLPLVRKAIQKLQGDGVARPKKVTGYAVERLLNLPSKRISLYLPLCKAEIENHQETQEQYWAKEVVWAMKKINREGETLNWKHIRELVNIRKEDLAVCLPYIQQEEKTCL